MVATYNGATYLLAQLESIAQQTHKPAQIIIVDDASSDDTVCIANNFAAVHPNVVVIQNETRLGYIKNFEKGMLLVTASYVALSDQDDIWEGEKIAQSGRGATWSDKADTVIGGGCYNCHQIDPKEISYGNIGPSLTGYGKLRGYSQEVVTYTWNRINNSKAYNACSNMPRFAHFKLLNEQQIQDVMALLLDPASPVNQ